MVDSLELMKHIKNAISILIDEKLKSLYFDRTEVATVKVVNADGTYTVSVNGLQYNVKPRAGLTFVVNDVVLVRIPNNNFGDRFIDCKKV